MEIGKIVLMKQLVTLGILTPDDQEVIYIACVRASYCHQVVALPQDVRFAVQRLWTSNGDLISRQYAGTKAMKVGCPNFAKANMTQREYTKYGKSSFLGNVKDTKG